MFRRTYDVITIGGATRDIMFYTPEGKVISQPDDVLHPRLIGFDYGAKILAHEAHLLLGGGGSNTATCFARLGLRTGTFLRVGLDRDGDVVVKELEREGVVTKFIERDGGRRTGFSFIVIQEPSKEHVAFLYRGSNENMVMSSAELMRAQSRWLYLSSLSDIRWGVTAKNLSLFLQKHRKTKLAWNPGEHQLKRGKRGLVSLLKRSEVFIVNADEARQLVVTDLGRVPSSTKPLVLAKVIRSWGPRVVVITQGKRGAHVFDGKTYTHEAVLPMPVVDTTGAGDSFGSTFVAGLHLFNNNIQRALRLAIVNSGSAVGEIGAQPGLLRKTPLLELAKKTYGKKW